MEQSPQKGSRKTTFLVLGVILLAAACALYIFLNFFGRRNDNLLYQERQSQMREVTVQLFSGLEDVIKGKWDTAHIQVRALALTSPATQQELVDKLGYLDDVADMDAQETYVFAVDSQGYYYTAQGRQGMLTERTYLLDAPERISYVSNTLSNGKARMNFLYRVDEDTPFTGDSGNTQIAYAGISVDMDAFSPYLKCDAYNSNNSAYVLDNDGYKLFNDSKYNLLQGYNILAALKNAEYRHGSTFEATLATLKKTGTAFSNAVLDGTEYYYALRRLQNAEWTLLFIIPSEYVAVNTVALMNSSTQLILLFATLMVVITGIGIFVVMRMQQQREIAIEVHSRQQVELANAELERTNKKLEQAQAATAEALQAAEMASKAKTNFLSNMSHDIRTPMNAIVGLTSLMEADPGNTEKIQEYLGKLESSSQHLLNLINEILDMNKIESGKATLNIAPFSMADQVAQIENVIRPQSRARSQRFVIQTHSIRHENLEGDATRLQQVLLNILSNAVKYTKPGGHISLDIEEIPREGHYARYKFTVTDNGMGMSKEFQKHIYESFTRAENSVTNKVQGTGLGMAITKNIVDMMGGGISLESELGKGSRFEVMLEFKINAEADNAVKKLSLLLLRCDDANFARIKDATENHPIMVSRTTSPEETVLLFQNNTYDVVLMPYMLYADGLKEAVQRIRRLAGDETILLGIASSQRDEALDLLRGSGLEGFIPLPFFLSNLEAEVARVRERRNSNNQQEEQAILKGMNFLCAEDNALNAEILQAMLKLQGASCTICHNGKEIVEKFKTVQPNEYDAILMDVQMPIMDGYEATRAIRSGPNPLGRTIPIIAMTANAFAEDVQKSYDASMDSHLSKPVDLKALEQTLRRFRRTPPRNRK